MMQASEQQQEKIAQLMRKAQMKRPVINLPQKRKVSDCTESSNSPLRKTKLLKKEKV